MAMAANFVQVHSFEFYSTECVSSELHCANLMSVQQNVCLRTFSVEFP